MLLKMKRLFFPARSLAKSFRNDFSFTLIVSTVIFPEDDDEVNPDVEEDDPEEDVSDDEEAGRTLAFATGPKIVS